jgi:hypothetical protein
MKRTLPALIFLSAILFFSCTKGPHNDVLGKTVTIDTTLASGTLYSLDLKPYCDPDDVATIAKQASGYTTSQILNGSSGFAPVYQFSASGDIKNAVNQQVVISITEGGNGRRHSCDSTMITINFKVQKA